MRSPGYFSFTRKERRGIIVILLLALFFTLLPLFYSLLITNKKYDYSQFAAAIAALKNVTVDSGRSRYVFEKDRYHDEGYTSGRYMRKGVDKVSKGELFYFDPNHLPDEGWGRLGIREKTIATIRHYLDKGGSFREPADIGKIWGLHEDEVKRLLPYVRIGKISTELPVNTGSVHGITYSKKRTTVVPIDINLADTNIYISLPGIGSRLANRIVSFREKLGGFYAVEQVAETFNLPDSTFKKILPLLTLKSPVIKKININTAGLDELKAHPYIRYYLANAIVQYRAQHGNFTTVDEIKKIVMVSDELYQKLAPYLVVE